MKPLTIVMSWIALAIVLSFGCQKEDPLGDLTQGKGTSSGAKMKEMIKRKQAPVRVVSMDRTANPLGEAVIERKLFTIKLENLSDCPVTTLKGTFVFYASDGQPIPSDNAAAEVIFNETLNPIPPESTHEVSLATRENNAFRGTLVIQQIVYKARGLFLKWDNPNYYEELKAAQSGERAKAR